MTLINHKPHIPVFSILSTVDVSFPHINIVFCISNWKTTNYSKAFPSKNDGNKINVEIVRSNSG